jgi:uncharacterized protein (TIGR00255 family)
MIRSMTGYAAASRELQYGTLSLEVRSVNHRYLDIQFRLPDELRAVEPALRETLSAQVARGKVECRIGLAAAPGAGKSLRINEDLLQQIGALETRVRKVMPGAPQVTAAEALRWPGVLANEPLPLEELQAACQELLAAVATEFTAARAREGSKLRQLMVERAEAMERRIAGILPRIPQVIGAYQERLAARLQEALGGGEEERIRQEVAVFATKIDVDEELSRLTAHVVELKRVLAAGGIVGKQLDFLMQELNREANTLSSKSVDLTVTQAALDLKLLIEQMREQVQNIE